MATEDYNDSSHGSGLHHLRRDVHDAHTGSQVARVLSILALLGAILALGLSIYALDKAGEAANDATRAVQMAERANDKN